MTFSPFVLNISQSYSPVPLLYEAVARHVHLKIFRSREVYYRLSVSCFN